MFKYLYGGLTILLLASVIGCGDNTATTEISSDVSDGSAETTKVEKVYGGRK